MSRQIFLPELLSINIKNYTLYPNGLDYTFDFVKGVNLVLGGNGMGKTTFVNIIKFGFFPFSKAVESNFYIFCNIRHILSVITKPYYPAIGHGIKITKQNIW